MARLNTYDALSPVAEAAFTLWVDGCPKVQIKARGI